MGNICWILTKQSLSSYDDLMLCSGIKLVTSWSQDSPWSNQTLGCWLLCLIHSCATDEVGGGREDDLRVKQSSWITTNWWLCFWFWGCNHLVTTAIWCKTAEWGNVMTVIIPVQWHHRGNTCSEASGLNEWMNRWTDDDVSECLPVWATECDWSTDSIIK